MLIAILKVLAAAILVSFVSWLSGRKTTLAGFLTALPLTTLLALAFSHAEYGNTAQSIKYAKSIFTAIPISLLFFIPFLVAQKFNWGFTTCYLFGISLLATGYFAHSYLSKLFV